MKVFVAGATGVLGRKLVPQLVARGHEVVGMTRSASKQDTPVLYAGTEVVEFSPTAQLGRTMEVVTKNMEEMEASSS